MDFIHPLIVLSGTTDWIYPRWGDEFLKFDPGSSLDFLCPGRSVVIENESTGKSILTGRCISGTTFSTTEGTPINWRTLSCDGSPWRDIRPTQRSCAVQGTELEIGFFLGDGRFLVYLMVCFNTKLETPYYTFINQTASINQKISGTARPPFLQGSDMYSIKGISSLYTRKRQRATINRLLGLSKNSTTYIKTTGNYYLARGHLTARADGFYAAQQNATFYMQNVAPQWQTLNGNNWQKVESQLRDCIEYNGGGVQVWSGVHGVARLPHGETGEGTELYLYVSGSTRAVPVPEIFYKVVYNPESQTGVALIGFNNPYVESVPFCDDVSLKLPWLNIKPNQAHGYVYACTVDSFRKIVTVLPNFIVKKLLV